MLRRLSLIFTDKDLRKKVVSIILLLILTRFLSHIPIPGLGIQDISSFISNDTVFSLLNVLSGGSYSRLSFVMIGISPFITASIIMQLLGVLVPKIQQMQREEGEIGKQKINRWTRLATLPLAALNAWTVLNFFANNPSTANLFRDSLNSSGGNNFWFWVIVVLYITAGSMIIMWIGEIISEYKMGNGTSYLIIAGIVTSLPQQAYQLWQSTFPRIQDLFARFELAKAIDLDVWKALLWQNEYWSPIRLLSQIIIITIVSLFLVVFVNGAVRKLVVVYSRRGHSVGLSRTLGLVKTILPIKVNMAGILPIIFAVSFLIFPVIVSRFLVTSNLESLNNSAQQVVTYLSAERQPSPVNLEELPKNSFLNFYVTQNTEELKKAQDLDTTQGQEILGFTLSSQEGVQNYFFEGTFLRFGFEGSALSFLPSFSFVWKGILAYYFFYFLLIVFFTYFSSIIVFKTETVAEDLQKDGAYIPGYRPGKETVKYLDYISNRLNVVGSLFLAIIAISPIVLSHNFGNNIVGGTSLILLVSAGIETLRQIEGQATAIDYDRFAK